LRSREYVWIHYKMPLAIHKEIKARAKAWENHKKWVKNKDKCGMCKVPIDKSKDKFYQQKFVENEKVIPVILCEDCMAELHKCPECGIPQPYCDECV
jgi:hypothetical protein